MVTLAEELIGQTKDWFVGHREKELPSVRPTPDVIGKWMFDEWALQLELANNRLRWPTVDFRRRLRSELGDGVEMFNERGWVDDPRSYHDDPPPLHNPVIEEQGLGRLRFEHLTFESGYAPHAGEPGSERWLEYEENATAHAWVLRHPGPPRPWLICINGYRTGSPLTDFGSFNARRLHRVFGLNLAFPVQPLHGPRAAGASGDRVIFAGAMNTVHTAAQALWDIRRLKSWIADIEKAPSVGVSGLSLGGYLTALLVCFEDDLACAIAGIPESDLVRGMRRNVEPLLPPFYEQWGLSWRSLERVNRVVSPLAMEPKLGPDRLFIFAGLVDRWVRPGNVKSLWEQWGRPEICWYPGGHLSFPIEPSVRSFVDGALERSGLVVTT
jgi:hypothetical protein